MKPYHPSGLQRLLPRAPFAFGSGPELSGTRTAYPPRPAFEPRSEPRAEPARPALSRGESRAEPAPEGPTGGTPVHKFPVRPEPRVPSDLEIPTFIRRQMD